LALVQINSAGSAGIHVFKRVNVNSEDNYVYFPNEDIPAQVSSGVSFIYAAGGGSIEGIDSGELVFAQVDSTQVLRFTDIENDEISFTGSIAGSVSLNEPIVFDNKLNIKSSTPSNQAVKYVTDGDPLSGLVNGETYFLRNVPADFTGSQALYDFPTNSTHTFTPCGAQGELGPTAQQIAQGYSTSWHGQFLSLGNFRGYQDWVVPISGLYTFEVAGASGLQGPGAGTAGNGAIVKGTVSLSQGETITIAVGQRGTVDTSNVSNGVYGSGGGSFVVRKINQSPIFVAGGGSSNSFRPNNNSSRDGQNGQTTTRGGTLAGANLPGGENGFGGLANPGASGGGGGFFGRGQDGFISSTLTARGGGSFLTGLTSTEPAATRGGGLGGFGGAGSSTRQDRQQSGGGGGYSGGAGARISTSTNAASGGGGGSFITPAAINVGTSNGSYEDLSIFGPNSLPIDDLSSFNNGDGYVSVTLVSSFTSGNTVHPTPEDAENGTNAIAIEPGGSSFHAFLPISYDILNNVIHFTSPHGFINNESVAIDLNIRTPDLPLTSPERVYRINRVNSFTIGLFREEPVIFNRPPGESLTDAIRKIVVNLTTVGSEGPFITIPSHGFTVDQPIQYSAGDGTAIGGLVDGVTYYVSEVIDANNFRLKNALNSPTSIAFTSAGTGTAHSFIFLTVNTTDNTLYIPGHNLVSGQRVKYSTQGGDPVVGLVNDQEYFVDRRDANTIRLATDVARTEIVNLEDVGTGNHALVIQSINFSTNTITIPAHGFRDLELVEYNSLGQTEVSGLTTNQTYYVILVDADNIRLASSVENAANKIAIDLQESPAGVGVHSLTSLTQTPDGIYTIDSIPEPDSFVMVARGQVPEIVKIFDPRVAVNIEDNNLFLPGHGFITGTKLIYDPGNGNTAVGGLAAGDCYAVVVNQNYIRLAETLDDALSGITIELTDTGVGTEHQFTTNQLNGRVVGPGNVSVQAGSILVDGVGTSFSKILKVGDPFILYPKDNIQKSLTFGDSNVNTGNNRIEISHPFESGDYVRFSANQNTTPGGLLDNRYYYVFVLDASSIQLYTTFPLDESGNLNQVLSPINFTSSGSGTGFTLIKSLPVGPIIRKITAVGSDVQVTVDRPYSEAYSQVEYAYPTFMYVRPSGYSLHRPFDGGVEMSTGFGNSFGQIIRQTRKYFRYQSGKGIQTSFAINFKPTMDLESMEKESPVAVLCKTRRPHNLTSGLTVEVSEAEDSSGNLSNLYNGFFVVTVLDDLTFLINTAVPDGPESKAYGFPQFYVNGWENGAIRSGMFDFQNGMFFEFDGQDLYCVRRSSTQQMAGTVSALQGSERIFGQGTRFTAQVKSGDFVVMRGQTYKVIDVVDDTNMSVKPEYRGAPGLEISFDPQESVFLETNIFNINGHGLEQNIPVTYNSIDGEQIGGLINGRTYYADVIDANNFKLLSTPGGTTVVELSSFGTTNFHSFIPAKSGIIVTKTVDVKVPQSEWNIDKCDGLGPSGYNLDLSRIQMCYMDYSWYGAGKVRFGFKTNDGLVRYVHEFKHNNILFESYFRSGNLPARYEVITFANPTYVPSLFHWGTSVIMDGTFDDDRGYLFTAGSQTLSIEGTTTKSFAGVGIDLDTDLITSLEHGFKTKDIVQFQSIAADGLPGLNSQNPSTRIVGSNELAFLSNTSRYGVLVNDPDKIHLTPPNAKFTFGATVSRTGNTITVTTAQPHGIPNGGAYVGIYGLTAANLVNGAFDVTVTGSTTFTYTVPGPTQTVSSIEQAGAVIAEVIDFVTAGNIQYTYFLHPDGSLNNTTGPNYQPLISLRLSPSSDSGLTGKLGDRDIINRMQVRMQEIGVSTNELVEVKLILNGRLNNLGFTPVDPPSLVELVEHTLQDTISGGVQIYNFQAEANSTTNLDLEKLFELSNSILGGDNIFPDGPDILTVAVSRLTGNRTRASAKLSWLEAQA
jgi:hypothetical protein